MKLLSLYREKLWIQVMIPISTVVAIVIIAIIIFNVRGQNSLIDKQLGHQSDVLIETLEGGMYDALAVGNNDLVRKQFQRLNERMPDMKIYVYDFNQNISFGTNLEMLGKQLDIALESRTVSDVVERMIRGGKSTEKSFKITIEGEPFNVHVNPILNEPRCYHCHGSSRKVLGGIAVCSSLKTIFSAIRDTRNKSIIIGISSLIALIILIYVFFNHRVNKRIKILLETAENVALGDLSLEKIKTESDEIGQVNASFMNMINSLQEIASVCEAIAVGDFSRSVKIRNDKDILGKSVNQMAENIRNVVTQADSIAEGDYSIEIQPHSEQDELGTALHKMTNALKNMVADYEERNLLKSAGMELNDRMRGEQDTGELAQNIITYICEHISAKIGALYIVEKDMLSMAGSYAYQKINEQFKAFEFNEGLVGQAAREKKRILVTDIPDDYIKIESGLGNALPRHIVLAPFLFEETVKGVIELGSFSEFSELDLTFLDQASDNIAIAVNSAQSRNKMESLFEQTKEQAEELQAQQEELRQTNEELEEQTQILEEQKEKIQKTNLELNSARKLLEKKAGDLEISSQYKSEFLANMSHELRTPLNSILLLSKLLYDNKKGSLTKKQVEFAQTIYSSGSDLLALINEILDLSKIESGRVELSIDDMNLADFAASMEQRFQPIAVEKDLNFNIKVADNLPAHIRTDHQRISQIVKNFLSNAFKFTSKGEIKLKIERPDTKTNLSKSGLDPEKVIAISVSDSGIGIAKDKFKLIFEAFKQADGTTSKKYEGTGLGLSISKELAGYLGGEIHLESEEGKGSVFTLYLPEKIESKIITKKTSLKKDDQKIQPKNKQTSESESLNIIKDDRRELSPEDKSILIIEDDPEFAKILCDLSREKGFKILVAGDGETGLHLADYYKPSAIMLDEEKQKILKMIHNKGAIFKNKKILLVDDDMRNVYAITNLLEEKGMHVLAGKNGREGLNQLNNNPDVDLVLIDIMMPEMNGYEAIREIRKQHKFKDLPVIALTAKAMKGDRAKCIEAGANEYLAKPVDTDKLLSMLRVWLY